MRRLIVLLLVLLLSVLVWADAHAGTAQVLRVCDNFKVKGQNGDALIVCPINATQGRVVLRIKAACQTDPPLRIWYRGKDAILTCGEVANPWWQPPVPDMTIRLR